jgi:hypothetical protein
VRRGWGIGTRARTERLRAFVIGGCLCKTRLMMCPVRGLKRTPAAPAFRRERVRRRQARRYRLGRTAGVRAGATLAPAFGRSERVLPSTALTSDPDHSASRRRGRPARLVARIEKSPASDSGPSWVVLSRWSSHGGPFGEDHAAAPPPAQISLYAWAFEEGPSTASRWTALPRPAR